MRRFRVLHDAGDGPDAGPLPAWRPSRRIAELEARVKEAEATAQAARAATAAKPSIPPPPNPEPGAGVPDDPAHPLLAARERLEPVRKLTHRLSREDFQFALDEAQRARGEAMGLIEKDLAANPRSVRALKARAQLRRMQGLDERQPN